MAPSQPYPLLGSSAQRPVRAIPIRNIAERRIDEFIGGQYRDYNLASMLFEAKTDDAKIIWAERWTPPKGEKPSWKEASRQEYTKCKKGDTFGPSWTNHWLKVHIKIPDEWRKKEWLQLEFDPSCEALIFSEDGEPLQGITGGFEDTRRVDFPLKPEYRKPQGVTFYVEVTCNAMFGVPSDYTGDPDPNRTFALNSLDIVIKRPRVWHLMWTFDMLSGAVKQMPRDGPLQNKALWVCNRIQDTFRKGDLASVDECHLIAEEVLGKGWEAKGAKVYEEGNWTDSDNTAIWSIGHTHIDTAWLWPFSATQQKVARSWCTQLDLMDRYPEYRFIASTAQQYAWLEELYPSLFERVRKAVQDGRFFPTGGTWVENDANMPSGEAFVRQFLYGQRWFKSRFGKRCDIFWLPDSFGYNAQIPQMARSAGLNYFFTQKLSWSSVNTFPHSSFVWQGLDGTQIITHMTPVNNYDSKCGLDDVRRGVTNNKNLDVQPTALLLFGYGDGGGGPNEVMLERQRRARAMYNNGYTEVPKVTVGRSADDFFSNIVKITDKGERLPTWIGEVYLEFHRGVYTSHGSIKRWNRFLEVLLHNIEWTATLASLKAAKGASGYKYPKAQLDDLWEPLLTNQFHDVLPGSSIRLVYDDAERIYGSIDRRGRKLLAEAMAALTAQAPQSTKASDAATLTVVNTLAVPRRELVRVPITSDLQAAKDRNDMTGVAQWGEGATALLLLEDAAASGMAQLVAEPRHLASGLTAASATSTGHNSFSLRNATLSLRVEDGRIVSIRDTVAGRELLEDGRTAGFTIFEDMPPSFDAWETELYSLNTREEIRFGNVRIAESGPWRAALALEARFGQSSIHLTISLDALSASVASKPRDARSLLRLEAEVDWHEKHRFLRFEVPTTLRSDDASYETQFGITKRPTHRNTTWDAAKFEVCGHRFVDLSEPTYGVALITNSKYGYSVEGGLMRISLLKAATYPDAHQDEGKHSIAFAIYPHAQHFVCSDVVTVARLFSNPLEVSSAVLASGRPTPPAVTVEGAASVIFDTMKRGEQDFPYYKSKGEGTTTVVLRLYESVGTHANVVVSTSLPVTRITSCNILEDDEEELLSRKSASDGLTRVKVALRGFQFRTLKLWLA